MEQAKVYEIVQRCTRMYAKPDKPDAVVQEGADVVLGVDVLVHSPVLTKADTERCDFLVDVHFVIIAVDIHKAEASRKEFLEELRAYPDPQRLAEGPNYIELGYVLGSQDTALRMLAVGKALRLWDVIIPEQLGFAGKQAEELAGRGMVYSTGFRG